MHNAVILPVRATRCRYRPRAWVWVRLAWQGSAAQGKPRRRQARQAVALRRPGKTRKVSPGFEKYYRWWGAEGHQPSRPSGHAVHQHDTEPLQYRLPAHCLASTSFLPCSAMTMPAGSWWGTGATDLNGNDGQHRSPQGRRYRGGWSKGWGGDRGWGRGVQDALVQAQPLPIRRQGV